LPLIEAYSVSLVVEVVLLQRSVGQELFFESAIRDARKYRYKGGGRTKVRPRHEWLAAHSN